MDRVRPTDLDIFLRGAAHLSRLLRNRRSLERRTLLPDKPMTPPTSAFKCCPGGPWPLHALDCPGRKTPSAESRRPGTAEWDARHEVLYATIRPTEVHSSKEVRATVIVDRDRRGKVTGIEVIL